MYIPLRRSHYDVQGALRQPPFREDAGDRDPGNNAFKPFWRIDPCAPMRLPASVLIDVLM